MKDFKKDKDLKSFMNMQKFLEIIMEHLKETVDQIY